MPQAESIAIPKRLPLVITPENRDETTLKDAKLVNGFVEIVREEEAANYWVYKRPGLEADSQPPGGAAAGCGVYNWRGSIYSIFGDTIYEDGVSIGTVDATGGVYKFSQSSGGTPRLVLGNGIAAYTFDGTTFAEITDADFPATFYKGWAYLDATTYVTTSPSAIRGSDLNNPTSWDPLNTITAQIEPTNAVATAKHLVYVVCLKETDTEVFYDAANSAGSPLSPVQGAKVNWGCVSADSVQDIDGILVWVATNKSAMVSVQLMENLKIQTISTKPVERLLQHADFSTTYSWFIKHEGHKFYVLTLPNDNLTLVYDLVDKMWAQWTDASGNYFPIVAATYNSDLKAIVQHESNGRLYIMDSLYYDDDGSLITVDIVTPNFDGGVRRRKQLNVMTFVGDQTQGSILQVRSNDNDYNSATWTNFRNVNLAQRNPMLTSEGTFYRRAYNFRHACNTPFRIQAVELQMDIGTL